MCEVVIIWKEEIVIGSFGRLQKCSAASVVEAYANAYLWLKAVEVAEETRGS